MAAEHVDVLIVGAGLSGIGAAYRLQTQCPGKTYAILEGRAAIGGTWDLFRYPGIRSDSDMFTLGYPFAPWKEAKAIADGPSILTYIRETAARFGIDKNIRFRNRATKAAWSSEYALWTVEVEKGDGTRAEYTANFLYMCSGYYSYEGGYSPEFPGIDSFRGDVIHPQKWPEGLDYAGKRVVVVGSGATAVTLVPAMAETAGHITMLQRSPGYIAPLPANDPIADGLRKILPPKNTHTAIRWKNVLVTLTFFQFCRRFPRAARRLLRSGVVKSLPEGYPVDPDFAPTYEPWDQRLCIVPDGDLFKAIRSGKADIVTDHIDRFTEEGIRLESGRELDADTIVTATGLRIVFAGGIKLTVDGTDVSAPDKFIYKGLMLSDVPNLAICIGYTNASWTLRADLSSQYVCRLINHMDEHGYAQCAPHVRDPAMDTRPVLNLESGYIMRAENELPKQGTEAPWFLRQNYVLDVMSTRFGDIEDDMVFSKPKVSAPA
ncbi:MAG: flavin-containing monooxygenase [Aeromicrobium sp.]